MQILFLATYSLLEKTDAGRDWGQEEKGTTEDEMAGWHHWLDRCESEWTPGVGDGQGGLACCDSWGRKELDMTELLNWTELNWTIQLEKGKQILSRNLDRYTSGKNLPANAGDIRDVGSQSWKRHVYPIVHHSTVYNSQDMEAT